MSIEHSTSTIHADKVEMHVFKGDTTVVLTFKKVDVLAEAWIETPDSYDTVFREPDRVVGMRHSIDHNGYEMRMA